MGKRYIDMDAYPRRAHFEYFSSMANPYMGVTVELDITDFCSRIKELGRPFFLSLLWCVNRAADSVPEFRQRIEAGRIVEFDSCRTSHTLALDDGTYCYCQLRASMPLGEYIAYASAEQERARSEQSLDDGDAKGQVRHEMAVHQVEMDTICPLPFDVLNVFSQAGEVRR